MVEMLAHNHLDSVNSHNHFQAIIVRLSQFIVYLKKF